jgi:hypothetical protein
MFSHSNDSEATAIASLITQVIVFLPMLLVSALGLYGYDSLKKKREIENKK